MTSTAALSIGIDLGTTNSVVAHFKTATSSVDVISSIDNGKLVPSYVHFSKDGSTAVGKMAKEMVVVDPENTMYEAKRLIGRTFDDESVQNDQKLWPFQLVNEGNNPKVEFRSKIYSPQDISAILLAELKKSAEEQLGHPVKYAVITVPAYFNDSQREATVAAGEMAGFQVLRIINEPTASILDFSLQRPLSKASENILVFDLGGGTFDISIVDVSQASVSVLAVGGDTHLGGSDFDMNLAFHCLEEFTKKCGKIVPTDVTQMDVGQKTRNLFQLQRLRAKCEACKISLSNLKKSRLNIDNFFEGESLQLDISRETFVALNTKIFDKCMRIMNEVREESKLAWSAIDGILLVGGSTKIPAIKDKIREFYQGQILETVDKDEAVARGAAILADILNPENDPPTSDKPLMDIADITPLSLGISNYHGDMVVFIPKHTRIPVKVNQANWTTAIDDQTSCRFSVYQGENKVAAKNCLLGQFTVVDIPAAPAGVEKFDVVMDLNANGILQVQASNLSDTNRTNGVTLIRSSSRMGGGSIDVKLPS